MIDLDSLRGIVARATGTGWQAAYRQDVAALVAEVERLRAERAAERAAVVAWLKKRRMYCMDSTGEPNAVTATYAHAAVAIERGEHLREEDK